MRGSIIKESAFIKAFLLVMLIAAPDCVWATQTESLVPAEKIKDDSRQISPRKFNETAVEEFRKDPDYQYHVVERQGLSWWDRFLLIFWNIIRQIFQLATGTWIGRLIFYLLCATLIIFAIIKLFNIHIKEIFFHSSNSAGPPIVFHEENIHEISFDDRIQAAFQQQDFRECVRLTFLYTLRKLSDQQIISWKTGKTNDEYQRELSKHPARIPWQELRLYFDYSWYGHFEVDEPMYLQIKKIFEEFNQKLK